MATVEIEERLARLEAEVAQLKVKVSQDIDKPVPWWQQISGVFKDDPAFDEAMRLGREWREAQRPDYDEDKTNPTENTDDSA